MGFLKEFFTNVWTKRCVSVVSLAFGVLVVILSYMSVFYDVQITNPQTFGITIGVVVVVLGAVMIYTRKTFITSLVSMITLLLVLPIIMFSWGNWLLIIPILVLAILMFFLCGASENTKTVVGTIYVFIYIMSAIAYLLYGNLIGNQTRDTKSENYVSESGTYRCYIVDTIDSSTGSTKIYVEPNDFDIHYNGITFIAEDYERIVYNIRERKEVNIEWRQDDLYVDNELRFISSDAVENEWFSFMDYKTRISSTILSAKKICNKISEKFLDKPIFDISNDAEEEETVTDDTNSVDQTQDVEETTTIDTQETINDEQNGEDIPTNDDTPQQEDTSEMVTSEVVGF